LIERGQLGKAAEAKVIEEFSGRRQKGRSTGRIAMANDLDPATLFERPNYLCGDCHTADVLDVTTRHRLTIGDDGQRFQHCT